MVISDHDTGEHRKVVFGEGRRGLWDDIHAKRKRGEKPAKKGDKDYPKTLDIDETYQSKDKFKAPKVPKVSNKNGKPYNKFTFSPERPIEGGENWLSKEEFIPEGDEMNRKRKSFCARSEPWDGERGKAARRRWNC